MTSISKMRGTTAVQKAFDGRRRLRPWRNNHFGYFDAVKAHPLAMCRFRPDEGGTVSTSLNINLAPVSGLMRSNAYVDVVQVFVPYQSIEKMWLNAQDDAGVTEMTKRRLLAGTTLPLGSSSEISKACNIHPRMVGGVEKVNTSVRLAYNQAVNHLRKAAYHDADEVPDTNFGIQPAVLTANILERFDGVLDPERHIDGAINLTGDIPVRGIAAKASNIAPDDTNVAVDESPNAPGGAANSDTYAYGMNVNSADASDGVMIETDVNGVPQIFVDLGGTTEITLRDMIQSQKLDGLIRQFSKMIEEDPINGEEVVERALYGLTVDFDANCQVMYRKVFELSPRHERPMDGASINDVSAHFELNTRFSTVVPRSELGGQLVTIAMVKPLETLEAQPDPAQTEAWELVNRVHDETELDEQLLTRADLESDVAQVDEDTSAFWVGHNSLKHNYATKGPNVQQTHGVEQKSTMWTYAIPTSVTPENVSYPAGGVNMYPFFNWSGGHAEYTIDQVAAISTPLAKGPNPIEKIQLFAADPTLVDPDA